VARPWRLRHKLVLGLALVVGSVAVLLGGALFGLSSFVETATATQRKMEEMQIVFQLRLRVQQIGDPDEEVRRDTSRGKRDVEKAEIDRPARIARDVLEAYKLTLHNDPVRLSLDPDGGEEEFARIARMEKAFGRLDEAVTVATAARVGIEGSDRLIEDAGVKTALAELTTLTDELFSIVMGDIKYSFERSAANHRRSLYIVGSATTLAVVLVLTLLYYFSVWIFSPIKALQAGVHRVHGGDFDHPIRLGSQDELEELANEFNAMTVRLRDVYADLARQVNERTRQLVRSERMVSVGFLAAGVAHEINNPLASIAFCAEALERRLQTVLARAPGEAEVILKYLRMMQEEAQRCKQITQKLLDFSRSGGRRESTDLTHLVQDVIEVAQC
jgi:HAMP domain-containing protein